MYSNSNVKLLVILLTTQLTITSIEERYITRIFSQLQNKYLYFSVKEPD